MSDRLSHSTIGVEHDTIGRIIDEANRKRSLQFSTSRLVDNPPAKPCSQHMKLGLAHRALEPQE